MIYTWRYTATGYNRKYNSYNKYRKQYMGPWRIERGPLKIPLPTALAFQAAWASKRTSVVGPAGMSNSQYA